jgi:hypothetical protein
MPKAVLKTCPKGHQFYKSSECPTCPVCEAARQPAGGILVLLSAPARRALESIGATTPKNISRRTEKELLALHGFGPKAIKLLKPVLKTEGLAFKKDA